ncbi:CapA family protein [Cohnella sp. AR92]|uniref:CapA family protein n=1 Tax=Cohnella sp. AR92 TaxID=648716 RepID=UPI000F8EC1C5|nr:CapA family protein [Cohnella sp. AR92]RUS45952.1 CapA family protein [Cohnella sp. AR92]
MRSVIRGKGGKSLIAGALALVILSASGCVGGLGQGQGNGNGNGKTAISAVGSDPSGTSSASAAAGESALQLAAVGDIMFHNAQLDSARKETGGYDFNPVFEQVKPILEAADIAMANFETTTAGDAEYPYSGYPRFNSPDESLDALKAAGLDVLTTANNHSLDTGRAGVLRTLKTIRERGMDSVGTYASRPESRVLLKEANGIKLAFLSYTESLNGLENLLTAEELDTMVNKADERKIREDVTYAAEHGADLIVAAMHWGNEYERDASEGQRQLAKRLADMGIDLIIGSHPHVIQPSEWLERKDGKKTFVIYSMGNFISNQRLETLDNAYTEDGVIARFDIRKDKQTGETAIRKVDFIPTWVYRDKERGQNEFTYRILPAKEYRDSAELSKEFQARANRSYRDTMAQLGESPDEE